MNSEAPARLVGVASLVDFAGNRWFSGSEADVMELREASLCLEVSFGLFFGSEAVLEKLWRASLWDHLWQGNCRAGGEPSGELPVPLEL